MPLEIHFKNFRKEVLATLFLLFPALCVNQIFGQQNEPVRKDILLNSNWKTVENDTTKDLYRGFELTRFADDSWITVNVPHNWDDYGGYRTMKHGNLHGYAWYRKFFKVSPDDQGKRFFLWFEGVGSYATVWVNGRQVGYHAGGRTTFTLDITNFLLFDRPNLLAVRADHPAGIEDLPWVCGGCSDEWGFSEGSQPMGIFRPVHLVITNPIRIEPFGVHVWNNNDISEKSAVLHTETEVINHFKKPEKITVSNRLIDKTGNVVAENSMRQDLVPELDFTVKFDLPAVSNPHLWSPDDPYLYKLVTEIQKGKDVIDRVETPFGIRKIEWSVNKDSTMSQLLINGKPVFINGTAEYEHLLGQSHAFSDQQVKARVQQVLAAGFNAFRDAHQPHNLRYQANWDSLGILWWPQFAAHIWYPSQEFRTSFKNLLTDWIKERRNSPSIILWGLENESKLPAFFAFDCSDLIRKLDPTATTQRKITTCNGGKGTDWNVPQNWTGTYGGNPATYASDIKKEKLVGEYGAWRSIDLHTEGPFVQKGILSEDRMAKLMETKVRLAECVRDSCYGQFHWLLYSHDNPGRIQNGDGFRDMDRVGPVNYKGLFTIWGEPLDVFYMFRANYVSKEKEPMVYIVSHTWPDRWTAPGIKSGITAYSNCDTVELFNDIDSISLGKRTRNGIGTHFTWDSVSVKYNVLYAIGYVNGKAVAKDMVVLNHLPEAPVLARLLSQQKNLTVPEKGYKYIYRVNCGGPDYTDVNGNTWLADAAGRDTGCWKSYSWDEEYKGLPHYFASQRRTFYFIKSTADQKLLRTFRYGRHKLGYEFPVPDGEYRVELYFTEPWYGIGGGMNCDGWRLFDVAINDSIVLHDFDIWKEAGTDAALKKTFLVKSTGGMLKINFPNVDADQAVISAIAIASANASVNPAPAPKPLIENLQVKDKNAGWSVQSWLDTGTKQYSNDECTFSALPHELYGDCWIRTGNSTEASFQLKDSAAVCVAMDSRITEIPAWLTDWTKASMIIENDKDGGRQLELFKKSFHKGDTVNLGENGKLNQAQPLMYTVIAHKPSVLENADTATRNPVLYEAEFANSTGLTISKAKPGLSGAGYVTGKGNISIEWTIKVGVGDVYALKFAYMSASESNLAAEMTVSAEDGTVMNISTLNFPSSPNNWSVVSSSTGTSINAGTYTVKLKLDTLEPISLDYLSVQ